MCQRSFSFKDRVIVSIVGTRQNTLHGRAFCEELTEEEQVLFTHFSKEGKLHLDQLALSARCKVSVTASLLIQMEMKGLIRALPWKYFEWI